MKATIITLLFLLVLSTIFAIALRESVGPKSQITEAPPVMFIIIIFALLFSLGFTLTKADRSIILGASVFLLLFAAITCGGFVHEMLIGGVALNIILVFSICAFLCILLCVVYNYFIKRESNNNEETSGMVSRIGGA